MSEVAVLWTVDKRKNDDSRPETNKQDLPEYYKPKTIYENACRIR